MERCAIVDTPNPLNLLPKIGLNFCQNKKLCEIIIKNQFSKKIVKVLQLKKIIGQRPRNEKVILCHGNFDVVHPGHVRHLTYAKTKAKIFSG